MRSQHSRGRTVRRPRREVVRERGARRYGRAVLPKGSRPTGRPGRFDVVAFDTSHRHLTQRILREGGHSRLKDLKGHDAEPQRSSRLVAVPVHDDVNDRHTPETPCSRSREPSRRQVGRLRVSRCEPRLTARGGPPGRVRAPRRLPPESLPRASARARFPGETGDAYREHEPRVLSRDGDSPDGVQAGTVNVELAVRARRNPIGQDRKIEVHGGSVAGGPPSQALGVDGPTSRGARSPGSADRHRRVPTAERRRGEVGGFGVSAAGRSALAG